jgi:hypothetical protein
MGQGENKMNQHQLRYAAAQAAMDAYHQEFSRRMAEVPEPPEDPTDAQIEAYAEAQKEVAEELGYIILRNELSEARKALLEWGKSVTLRIATPDQRAELAEMYDKLYYHRRIMEQVIDIIMRMDA